MPSYWKEESEPNRPKKAKNGPIRPLSDKRAADGREKAKAYAKVLETRPALCEETGMANYDFSHNFPVKHFPWLMSVPENMTLLNRDSHMDWENARLHELPNTAERTIMWMLHAAQHETDVGRKKSMFGFINNKLFKCADICMEEGVEVPEWVQKLLT